MSIHALSNTHSTGDRMFAAYRNAWLASLGAAAVTRDWMQTGAAPLIRSLVREGTLVEGQAMRAVESRIGSSYRLADATLRRARKQIGAALGHARTTLPVALANLPQIARRVTLVVSAPRAKPAPAAAHVKSTAHAAAKRNKQATKRAVPQTKPAGAVHSVKRAKSAARSTPKRQGRNTARTRNGA